MNNISLRIAFAWWVALVLACAILAPSRMFAADAGLPVATPEQAGFSAERLARVRKIFDRDIAEGKFSGGVAMVSRRGKVVLSEAYGFQDKAKNLPMTTDSIFRIYSMSKALTSVGAMILVEDGTIQLTDPLSKYFPSFKDMKVSVPQLDPALARVSYTLVAAERPITIQDLLRHTAGFAYGEITTNIPVKSAYTDAGFVAKTGADFDIRNMTPEDEMERLAKAPLATQPGAIWEYSVAVDVLGRVVEVATGKRLSDFLQERLFQPLQMSDTAFWLPPEKLSRLAQPFAVEPATGVSYKLFDMSAQTKNDSGGAGLASTAGDYLRFGQMLLDGGALGGTRILSPTTVRLMTSDHLGSRINDTLSPVATLLGTPGYTFGLGFAVRTSDGIVGEAGSVGEFLWVSWAGSFFWVDPKEELVGVFLTQTMGPPRSHYRHLFKQLVYQAIID